MTIDQDNNTSAARDTDTSRQKHFVNGGGFGDMHASVAVPTQKRWLWRMMAFGGPAYIVAVGYMDPGNWATDIAGGAQFGYTLIWILLLSNLMAVLLQTLSARLGLATGRDLAQACRDDYHPVVRYPLFALCQIAIVACDLAEVLGTAIGLNLLFGIPMIPAVVITGLDVFLLLAIQRLGVRKFEAFILSLISIVGLCFIAELFLSPPSASGIARGFVPGMLSHEQLYIAIGIIGATVMPHNLYLHSSLVQSRDVKRTPDGIAQACRYNLLDTSIALNAAFFVNAAILILAASAFWSNGIVVTELKQAYHLLNSALGSELAPVLFGVALICAGQSSTLTGTLAGQITMEGFLHLRMRPWLNRLLTRMMAIVPAVAVIALTGEGGTYELLIFSQVLLSLQLPFAVVPLVRFTASKKKMGPFANRWWMNLLGGLIAVIIITLNVMLVFSEVRGWIGAAGPVWGMWIAVVVSIVAAALAALLLWLIFKQDRAAGPTQELSALQVAQQATGGGRTYARIGVALEAKASDGQMLAEAISIARAHQAHLVLIHIVEGAGGQWYGQRTRDLEARADEKYIQDLKTQLSSPASAQGSGEVAAGLQVTAVLGHGHVVREIARLARDQQLDLLVMGGHGHGRIGDIFHGETITGVRHRLEVPVLSVRRN